MARAVSRLRQAHAEGRKGAVYIETLRTRGFRFRAPVTRAERDSSHASLEAHLAPYRRFVYGQSELDTLDREAIQRAHRAFEDALRDARASSWLAELWKRELQGPLIPSELAARRKMFKDAFARLSTSVAAHGGDIMGERHRS